MPWSIPADLVSGVIDSVVVVVTPAILADRGGQNADSEAAPPGNHPLPSNDPPRRKTAVSE
jgi:hypothetical protein